MSSWVQRRSMPTPRHDLQAVAVGSKIYAISGADDETLSVVEVYDAESDSWTPGPSIPTRRGWFGAALLGGSIYAIAGKRVRPESERRETGDDREFVIRNTVDRLDVEKGTWSSETPLSRPRAGLVATVCKGKIYAIGGNSMDNERSNDGTHLDSVEVFDPATGGWELGPSLPLGLQGPAVATIDDRIYVTAGFGGPNRESCDKTFVLEPPSEEWESLAPIPTGRGSPGVLAAGRKIYVFGGRRPTHYYNEVEVYDVDEDSWSSETPMPVAKGWMASALVDNRIFVMGGAHRRTDGSGFRWIEDLHELVPD